MKDNEAYAVFMAATVPQAVLSATEPHGFLYVNKKFVEIFRHTPTNNTTSTIATKFETPHLLFLDLIRVTDNPLKLMAEIQDFIKV